MGWVPVAFAEHDPEAKGDRGFAAALLAHYWPHVPNLGDIGLITEQQIAALGPIDLVVGGTPCQDLSVAGLRAGIDGERSSLFFDFVRIFDAARRFCGARFCLWENVPGALSSNQGRDFARVVGALAGSEVAAPADGWGSEGVALGDRGLVEWSVLDAQWFNVAQRRERVFALLDAGDWESRRPVLLEPESMRGDSAPRRAKGSSSPAGALRRTDGGSDVDRAQAGHLIANTLCTQSGRRQVEETLVPETSPALTCAGHDSSEDGTDRHALIPEVADPLVAGEGKTYTHEGEHNFRLRNVVGSPPPVAEHCRVGSCCYNPNECDGINCWLARQQHAPDVAVPLTHGGHPGSNVPGRRKEDDFNLVAHPITAREMKGADSQGTSGNIVACFDTTQITHPENRSTCSPETAGLASSAHPPAIALRSDASRDGVAKTPSADAEGKVRLRDPGFTVEIDRSPTLDTGRPHSVMPPSGAVVRRLTPTECERLQGFPDGYTLITYRGKPASDSARYAALGNSMAVPVVRKIGSKLEEVLCSA